MRAASQAREAAKGQSRGLLADNPLLTSDEDAPAFGPPPSVRQWMLTRGEDDEEAEEAEAGREEDAEEETPPAADEASPAAEQEAAAAEDEAAAAEAAAAEAAAAEAEAAAAADSLEALLRFGLVEEGARAEAEVERVDLSALPSLSVDELREIRLRFGPRHGTPHAGVASAAAVGEALCGVWPHLSAGQLRSVVDQMEGTGGQDDTGETLLTFRGVLDFLGARGL